MSAPASVSRPAASHTSRIDGASGSARARSAVVKKMPVPTVAPTFSLDLDIDVEKIMEANSVTKECLKDYEFPPEALGIDTDVIFSPMPGGALTANTLMMRENKTFHKFPQVIKAMAECVARGGFATSVTPVSQFYFQQAYANVMMGPWKKMTDGYGNMVLGYYGKTPVAPDPEIVKIAAEQMKKPVFTGDPIKGLEPGIPKAKKILEENKLPVTDENIFIVGAFATKGGNKGLDFLKGDFKVSVPKKDPNKVVAAPAAVAPPQPAAAPAQAQAPAPRATSAPSASFGASPLGANQVRNYHVTVGGKSIDLQVEHI